jgi:hypothetical protein
MFQQIFKKIYTISNQNHHILIKKWVKSIFLCYKYKYLYMYLNEFTVLGVGVGVPPWFRHDS